LETGEKGGTGKPIQRAIKSTTGQQANQQIHLFRGGVQEKLGGGENVVVLRKEIEDFARRKGKDTAGSLLEGQTNQTSPESPTRSRQPQQSEGAEIKKIASKDDHTGKDGV